MVDYNSFDPRYTIRKAIGTTWWTEEEGELWTVNITDDNGDTVRIPLLLAEEVKTESLDEMPYMSMRMVYTTYEPHDIGAETRKRETYIDVHLYFTDTDNISTISFGKAVADKMHDLVRDAQCTFAANNDTFMNIREVRYIEEKLAHQVVFHYIFTIYAIHYDNCQA